MRVRVVGASREAILQLRAIAPTGMDVVDEPIAEPDWILVATASQRIEVSASNGLPPFRILEVPEIAGGDRFAIESLRAALVKMSHIGAYHSRTDPLGVRVAAMIIRRLLKAH